MPESPCTLLPNKKRVNRKGGGPQSKARLCISLLHLVNALWSIYSSKEILVKRR